MGKKMHEKDGHTMGNNQVEEGNAVKKKSDVLDVSTGNMNDVSELSNRDDDKNKRKEDNNKKKDRIKKRKSEFDTDEKGSQKAQKKHKKSKDAVGEVKEISMEACLGGKENTEQESSEAMYLENNFDWEAKRVRKEKHKNKNRDGIDAVSTVTETLEHSNMQEPVEAQKVCSTEDINKIVAGKEGEYEKQKKKKKKQKLQKLSGNVGGHIAVSTDGNDTDQEDSTGNKVACRKLGGDGGDAENGNRSRKKKSKSVKNGSEGKHCKGDAGTTVTETLEHSKMQEPVEALKTGSTGDINKIVPGKEGEHEKRKKKKKKQKLEEVSGNVGGHIAVSTDGNDTDKEDSTGNKVECRKLGGDGGDTEDGNSGRKKKSKLVKNGSEGKHCKGDVGTTVNATLEHSKMQEPVEALKIGSTEDINKIVPGKEGEHEKRKKKKKQKLEKVSGNVGGHIAVSTDGNDTDKEDSTGNKVECRKLGGDGGDAEDDNSGRKKKSKSVKNGSVGKHHKGDARNKSVSPTIQSENATPKERCKRVSFCDHVEVFPSENVIGDTNKEGKEGLVYGRRYTKEEDEIIMNAVADYIESHNLGDEGLNMVLHCGDYPQVRNCWKEIQAGIPWRPVNSVYHRAHVLFERDEKRPWTPEEYEVIRKFVKEHGPKWKLLADSLGKHRHHVKDTWRRIKLTNRSRGQWSQEEYQNFFDLVNLDLSMKASEEKKSKHGMLRDNICWTAISDKLQSRAFAKCCIKWYGSLASPMVAEGTWADVDDYRMLDALSSLDACCMEDVDWDNLIEHRSGDLCRKRWNQMVRHLGPLRDKSFAEQVEILANRYHPDMLDVREAYDSKRPVDL